MSEKTRAEIVRKCAGMVTACFNYYSDTPLPAEVVEKVTSRLEQLLPAVIETAGWQQYSDEYQRRVMMDS